MPRLVTDSVRIVTRVRKRETETLLGEAGFRNVDTRFILTLPAIGRMLRAVDQFFARIPLGAQYFTVGRV